MVKVKRARTAETLKPPNLRLRLRAPYFYPDYIISLLRRPLIFLQNATRQARLYAVACMRLFCRICSDVDAHQSSTLGLICIR